MDHPMDPGQMNIRAATAADLAAIAAIQASSREAAQWDPAAYLGHDCMVGEIDGRVVGFLVTRRVAPGESEILNLAVDPAERRSGVARELLTNALACVRSAWFLEVRASNQAAIRLYEKAGFARAGLRSGYYREPAEEAIVMRFDS
jgi:ribosomal-protein-alanine N-acetyltransferase